MASHEGAVPRSGENKETTFHSAEDEDVPYLSEKQRPVIEVARRQPDMAKSASSGLSITIPDPPPPNESTSNPGGPLYLHILDSSRNPVTIIDASATEDPFLLESFEAMIKASHTRKKHFIVARVATRKDGGGQSEDKVVEDEVWWSYYHAQFLNKVLFRTEPEKRLLHRMRAKNPLNNLPIVGEAEYFIVRWNQSAIATETQPEELPETKASGASVSGTSSTLRERRKPSIESDHNEKTGELPMGDDPAVAYPRMGVVASSISALAWLWGVSTGTTLHSPPAIQFRFIQKPYENEEPRRTVNLEANEDAPFVSRRYTDSDKKGKSVERTPPSPLVKTPLSTGPPNTAQKERWDDFLDKVRRQHEAASCLSPTSANNPKGPAPDMTEAAKGPESRKMVAEFLGTDDDFLLRSEVRQIFRENALESDEAVLFALPSSVKYNVVTDAQDVRHPRLDNVVIVPMAGSDATTTHTSGSTSTASRMTPAFSWSQGFASQWRRWFSKGGL